MNIIDLNKEFATEEACLAHLEKMRWPEGVRCPMCGANRISKFQTRGKTGKVRHLIQCLEKTCRYQFAATTGTIFHDTHLPLQKWFLAIALVCNAKKGLSAKQMQRDLGVAYRTAWYLYHRIREAMQEPSGEKLKGIVEVDETYVGGKYDRRRKRGPWEKVPVIGLVERKGRLEAKRISHPSKAVLTGVVRGRVSAEAEMVITDQHPGYAALKSDYRHQVVNHIRQWVRARTIHTNTIENFWSLFKRGLVGSFHKVSAKHLHRYLNEFTYRFNRRGEHDLFGQTVGRLLTREWLPYQELVAP